MLFPFDFEFWWVYGLVDPDTGEIRYVGKSTNPRHRLSSHLSRVDSPHETLEKNEWLRGLLAEGKQPRVAILGGALRRGDAEQQELGWTEILQAVGQRLFNQHNLLPSDGCFLSAAIISRLHTLAEQRQTSVVAVVRAAVFAYLEDAT